jgi:hypothetical protein
MAAFMRQGGKIGIAKWLHGFIPASAPLASKSDADALD